MEIGLILFPRLTQLDLTGPFEAFARIPNANVHLIWKSIEPVISDTGLRILPTITFEDCPDLDVICVPGGPGINALLDDQQVLAFVRRKGEKARYVTSVCSGALVLGAAGLLKGYKAATHWASREFLPPLGATPVNTRVCIDGNRITGGGVTAGIDFALHLTAQLTDRKTAKRQRKKYNYIWNTTPSRPIRQALRILLRLSSLMSFTPDRKGCSKSAEMQSRVLRRSWIPCD